MSPWYWNPAVEILSCYLHDPREKCINYEIKSAICHELKEMSLHSSCILPHVTLTRVWTNFVSSNCDHVCCTQLSKSKRNTRKTAIYSSGSCFSSSTTHTRHSRHDKPGSTYSTNVHQLLRITSIKIFFTFIRFKPIKNEVTQLTNQIRTSFPVFHLNNDLLISIFELAFTLADCCYIAFINSGIHGEESESKSESGRR